MNRYQRALKVVRDTRALAAADRLLLVQSIQVGARLVQLEKETRDVEETKNQRYARRD